MIEIYNDYFRRYWHCMVSQKFLWYICDNDDNENKSPKKAVSMCLPIIVIDSVT